MITSFYTDIKPIDPKHEIRSESAPDQPAIKSSLANSIQVVEDDINKGHNLDLYL